MDERKIRIGDPVKIKKTSNTGSGRKITSIRNGTVTALYEHFFCVRIGSFIECFRWNEFYGNEEVKVILCGRA